MKQYVKCVKCEREGYFSTRTCHRWSPEEGRMKYCGMFHVVEGHHTPQQMQRMRNDMRTGSRKGKPRTEKWRRCNNCGHTAFKLGNHHTKGGIYCGYMRVIRGASDNPDVKPGEDVE